MVFAYLIKITGFGDINFMGRIGEFAVKILSKARGFSIHLSILVVTIFGLSGNIFFGEEVNNSIVWTGLHNVQTVDTKKTEILLSYLTKIVPPLESSQYSQGLGFYTEGTNFFDKPSLPNTIISGLPRDKITTYTVSEGETYWTIAYKFELDIDTLLWANGITDVNNVQVGKELIILPTSGLLYTTVEGDTLQGVADAFKIAADKIKTQNQLASNTLPAGLQLVIPGARKEQPKPAVTTVANNTGSAALSNKPNYAGDNYYYTGAISPGTGAFGWPINSGLRFFSQYFGWVTKTYKHTGVDLDWRNGTDIIASDSGTVVVASYGWGGGYGNHVIIDHGNGYQTLYGHLSQIDVKPGQVVTRGQHIGIMGTTGISTGVHLHFEIRQGGVAINPLIYIK